MALTNNNIQLLIALGINDEKSKNNINEYIKQLKGLEKVSVELDVDGAKSTKSLSALENQVKQLQEQIKSFNGSSKGGLSSFGDDVEKNVKSMSQLKNSVKEFNGTLDKTFNAKDQLTGVTTAIRNAKGELEKTKFKPIFDGDGVIEGFEQIRRATKNIDTKDLQNNIKLAIDKLKELGRQGQLTAKEVDMHEAELRMAKTNDKVKELTTSFSKLHKDMSHDDKMSNSMANINKEAIALSQTLDKLASNKDLKFNDLQVGQLREDLSKLASVNFDNVKDMNKAIKDLANTSKSIKGLDLNAKEQIAFNNALKGANGELESLRRKGKITTDQFADMSKQINNVGNNDTKGLKALVDGFKQIGNSTTDINKIKNALDSIPLSVQTLESKLERLKQAKGSALNTADVDNFKNKIQEISSMKINTIDDVNKLASAINNADRQMTQLSTSANHMSKFEKAIQSVTNKLSELAYKGDMAETEIAEFSRRLSAIPKGNLEQVSHLLTEINGRAVSVNREIAKADFNIDNANNIKRLNSELTKTEKLFSKSVNKEEVAKIRKEIEILSRMNILNPAQMSQAQKTFKSIREDIKNVNAEATTASRNSMGIIESFKTAMMKFPVWMAASTIFFSSIRSAKEFMDIIVDIDTKLVSISKVMSEDMDLNTVFDRATLSAETFGQSISQALDAYIEFARQGYKGADLGNLADAGLVAANVGEISAQQASEYMTASLVQWNKETDEAMGIIDSWNAISNTHATTVEKLAQGQSRAGATARAMGLEYDQLNAIIGTVTAATKQSGNEVGNFIKSSLPRLVGKPAQNALSSLGISLTDDAGNMRDIIEVYTEVANKIKDVNDTQRIAVVEGLAGKYHISRMQALLDDLGSVDSMYQSMYKTSVDSAGSAMTENEKFMDSLQARINLLRVEVEKLAVTLGEAFLTEGMIQFISMSSSLLGAIASIVGTIGGIPLIMATAGFAFVLFSKTAKTALASTWTSLTAQDMATRKLVVSQATLTASTGRLAISKVNATRISTGRTNALRAEAIATNVLARASGVGAVAMNGLKVAMRSLLMASGVGILFVGVGFALEKLVSWMGKGREEAEDLASANKQMLDSYSQSSSEIDKLTSQYVKLEEAMSVNPDVDTISKYRDVQSELATLMPSLVTGEDQYGNKLIISADLVKIKTEMLKEELAVQQRLNEEKEKAERDTRIETNEGTLNESIKEYDSVIARIKNISSVMDSFNVESQFKIKLVDENGRPLPEVINNIGSLMDDVKGKINQSELSGDEDLTHYYKMYYTNLKNLSEQMADATLDVSDSTSKLKGDYLANVMSIINTNKKLTDDAKTTASEVSGNLLTISDGLNLQGVNDALESIFGNVNASSFVSEITSEFDKLDNATYETFTSVANTVQDKISGMTTSLKEFGLSDAQIKAIQSAFNQMLTSSVADFNKLQGELKGTGITLDEARINALEFAEGMDEASDSAENLANRMRDANSIHEELAGVSEKHVSDMDDLLYMYDALTNQLGNYSQEELERIWNTDTLTASEQSLKDTLTKRKDIMNTLAQIYPDLLAKDEKAIALSADKLKAMQQEEHANKVLLEAYKLSRDGKLNAEQDMTLAQATGTKTRIENMKQELAGLILLQQQMKNTAISSQEFVNEAINGQREVLGSSFYLPGVTEKNIQTKINVSTSNLDEELAKFNGLIGNIDSYSTSIKDSSKSSKDANSTTKESIYIADKYKQSMEALTLEIEKQQKLQSEFPDYSATHRKSLEAELKLQKQKLELMQKQSKEMQAQINSGKIKQTGTITSDSKTSSSTTSGNKVNGAHGKITSGYGMRMHPTLGYMKMHDGVDIAGKNGSRLDSFTSGKVTSQGFNNISGNYVKIEDSNGFKHFYAHLDKAFAKVGDVVQQGQQIGNIGSTGRSTGPHLHYEVKNASGNYINPNSYVTAAKSGKATTTTSSKETLSTVDKTQQAIDDAKSALLSLNGDILAQQQLVDEFASKIINSQRGAYEHKRKTIQENYDFESAKLKNVDKDSSRYLATMDKQVKLLESKQNYNKQELDYLEGLIAKGGLSSTVLDEMTSSTLALKTEMQNLNNAIGQLQLDKITSKYDTEQLKSDNTIAYENQKLAELDRTSQRYTATMEKLGSHYKRKADYNQKEIDDLNKLIKTGKYSGEVLANMKAEVQALTVEMMSLHQQMKDADYEIVISIKTQFDEKIDDLNFEIERSKAIQGMYDEGSADAKNEMTKQIGLYEQMAKKHDESRRKLQQELNQRNLLPERIKEITELMEDESIAYNNTQVAVLSLTKELEKANEQALEQIANAYISAYKEYVQERRDEHIKMIDDELEAEDERHEQIMKQYTDEMDLFRKNVEEKLKLIDLQEAQRSYDMEIDDLEKERNKVQSKFNELAIDDSFDAKSKKKKLQEELDKIDKDIAEKRHERDITLQKEALNDMLEAKEIELGQHEDIEDKRYDAVKKSIDRQKEYWDKHYNDLLNDERRFAEMRKLVMEQNFTELNALFDGYINEMVATMPRLEDSLDGTMKSVGTSIRQNVIDNLREAMNMVNEFNATQIATNKYQDSFNPNEGKESLLGNANGTGNTTTSSTPNTPSNNSSPYKTNLELADQQVMFGKFLNDILANDLKSGSNERADVKSTAYQWAENGRNAGSTIPDMQGFNATFGELSSSMKVKLKNYIRMNASGVLSGSYGAKIQSMAASLDTGGFINSKGLGIDGKGGKNAILHPNEVVLDAVDTKGLIKNIDVMDRMVQTFSPILNMFKPNSLLSSMTTSTGGDTIEINFGDVNNTTQASARTFANEFVSQIKTRKGGW